MVYFLLIIALVCGIAGFLLGTSAGAQVRREDKARYRRACGELVSERAARIRLSRDVAELGAHVWDAEHKPYERPGVN